CSKWLKAAFEPSIIVLDHQGIWRLVGWLKRLHSAKHDHPICRDHRVKAFPVRRDYRTEISDVIASVGRRVRVENFAPLRVRQAYVFDDIPLGERPVSQARQDEEFLTTSPAPEGENPVLVMHMDHVDQASSKAGMSQPEADYIAVESKEVLAVSSALRQQILPVLQDVAIEKIFLCANFLAKKEHRGSCR